jgi:hypothetical protein
VRIRPIRADPARPAEPPEAAARPDAERRTFWATPGLYAPMRLLWIAPLLLASALGASVGARAATTPAVRWVVSGGGVGSDDADGVGTDARGRIVISGGFEGANAGSSDVFATGYGKRGRLRWTRRFGGPGADQSFDNDVDPRGDAVLTGSFNNRVDFGGPVLVSRGATLPRYGDAFLLKLGRHGRTKWVRQIGGSGSDGGDEVAIGPHRNIYVIGDANGPVAFTPSVALSPGGGRDAWAARYRPDGSLVWARSLGGPGEQQSHGINVDADGKALVTGEFQGTALFGSQRLDSAGSSPDVFIAKLDRLGRVRWAQRFGDADREIGRGIDADSHGNVYFGGEYQGTLQLGATTLRSAGSDDVFLAKANRAGRVRWAIGMGGTGAEVGPEVEVDGEGNSYLTGSFTGVAHFGDKVLTASGLRGAFVAKVAPDGRIAWVVQSTDSGFATLGELSLGPNSVNVLGRFAGTAHLGPFSFTSAGATDYFLGQLKR